MAGFYSARSRPIPPLPWQTFAPPFSPALVAMRFNPDLKAKYEKLREAGKPAKIAIVAIMRKLVEIANALVKADRLWAEKPTCA